MARAFSRIAIAHKLEELLIHPKTEASLFQEIHHGRRVALCLEAGAELGKISVSSSSIYAGAIL